MMQNPTINFVKNLLGNNCNASYHQYQGLPSFFFFPPKGKHLKLSLTSRIFEEKKINQ